MTHSTHLSERRYDLDWLRVLTILSVFFYHIGMFFNTWGWHLKNPETTEILSIIMSSLHTWRLPLLLFVAGAGTILASTKRNTWAFVKERHRRLFIPLLFGMLVVVPPQIYVEYTNQYSSYWQFYLTVFEFQPYPGGSFSWHHLWFVLYLLVFSMIALPFMNFLKSERSDRFLNRTESYLSKKWGYQSIALIILVSQILLRPYYPENTHDLINDWANFSRLIIFFLAGMLTCSSDKLWQALVDHRRFNLYLTLLFHVILYFLYFLPFKTYQPYVPFSLNTAWDLNVVLIGWSTVITVIGYGRVYLNKNHRLLKPMNEGIYPFYILHQTVILVFGYMMLDWQLDLLIKIPALTILSLIACALIYQMLIKPYQITRLFFGMRPLKRQ